MDLLVNKYKPSSLSEIVGNKQSIKMLNMILEKRNLPNLLLTGPPGTGKTTSAKILSSLLLPQEDILELNASDERGIDTVRTKIKDFAQKKTEHPYKIIILDECDSMTTAAQQALRRIMEVYPVRFILICNQFSKIFEPVQSRCAVVRFDKIEEEEVKKRISEICIKEGIKVECMNTIIELGEGDIRQTLNILQGCNNEVITEEFIVKIMGVPSPKLVGGVVDLLLKKKKEEAFSIFDDIWERKYDPEDLIGAFFREAKKRDDYELVRIVGDRHCRIVKGLSSKLQFYGMFHEILKKVTM